MRLVFVNHAHPDVAHVSGMRFGFFARALAARGHKVVLLTASLTDTDTTPIDSAALSGQLTDRDWCTPLVVSVSPSTRTALLKPIPHFAHRCVTLWRFLRHSGVYENWTSAAAPRVRELATVFRPHAVWGTFGNTSNLALAQAVARATGCPWIIDVKDNWSTFLRPGVRELMAWRFRDAVGYTSNALHHQHIAGHWLWQTQRKNIYSGVADEFFSSEFTANAGSRALMLVGSTYDAAVLDSFLRATKHWAHRLPSSDRDLLTFVYAGADHERVAHAVAEVRLPCRVEVAPYLRVDTLAYLCRNSFANCYLWAKFTFHHKLLELLACGRPVISFPGEAAESKKLASLSPTSFASCAGPKELHFALTRAWNRRESPPADTRNQQWKWSDRTRCLEAFFREVAQGSSQCAV